MSLGAIASARMCASSPPNASHAPVRIQQLPPSSDSIDASTPSKPERPGAASRRQSTTRTIRSCSCSRRIVSSTAAGSPSDAPTRTASPSDVTNDRDAHSVASQRIWMDTILSPVACAAQSPTEPTHLAPSTYLHRIEGIGRTKFVAPVLAASLSVTNTPRSSARLRRTCAPTSNSMR